MVTWIINRRLIVGSTNIKLFQELYRCPYVVWVWSVPLCCVFKVVFIKFVQIVYGSNIFYTEGIRYCRSLFYCRIRMDGVWFSKICEKNQSYNYFSLTISWGSRCRWLILSEVREFSPNWIGLLSTYVCPDIFFLLVCFQLFLVSPSFLSLNFPPSFFSSTK